MLPAERLGRILSALLGEGRPRTIRGAACSQAAGRRPSTGDLLGRTPGCVGHPTHEARWPRGLADLRFHSSGQRG